MYVHILMHRIAKLIIYRRMWLCTKVKNDTSSDISIFLTPLPGVMEKRGKATSFRRQHGLFFKPQQKHFTIKKSQNRVTSNMAKPYTLDMAKPCHLIHGKTMSLMTWKPCHWKHGKAISLRHSKTMPLKTWCNHVTSDMAKPCYFRHSKNVPFRRW